MPEERLQRNPFDMGDEDFPPLDRDDQLQKAIQASLQQPGGNKHMNDTFNDEEFKRILEMSRKEK